MIASLILSIPFVSMSLTSGGEDTTRTYLGKEVIVNANRMSGEVLGIPLAVSIVRLKDIPSRKLSMNEALSLVPGVFAQSRSGGEDVRLTIRGFGARASGDRSNAAIIRGIKILIDGIPETEPDGRTPLDLIDLNATERIEIFRSNSSTLFGNASGGVINLQTGAGTRGTFLESANSFGDFGFRKNNVSFGAAMGSTFTFVSISNTNFDGWRQSSSDRSTKVNAVVDSRLDESTNLRVLAGGATNIFYIPGALTQSQFDADPTQANATYASRQERRFNRTGRLAFDLNTAFFGGHALDVLAYVTPKVQARSERGQYRDFNRYHIGGGLVYSWTGEEDFWLKKLLVGSDEAYQDGSILFYNLVNGDRGDSLRTNKREGAETFGVFLQTELRLSDNLIATIGGRFDKQRYIAEEYAAGVKRVNMPEEFMFDHLTPKVALLYRWTQAHSLYANIGGGLEAPAFNEVDPPPGVTTKLNPFLAPMISTTYELGAKGFVEIGSDQLLRAFSYSVAAYRIGVTNEIVPWSDGAYFFSSGHSTRTGFELSTEASLPSGFSFGVAFTYLDAGFDTYTNNFGDFAGKTVPGIPKSLLNSRIRYSNQGVSLEAGFDQVGEYFADEANSLTVPSSTVFNAHGAYSFNIGAIEVSISAGVNNFANLKYASSAFINPVAGGAFLEPGMPRNLFGGFELKWTP